MPLDIARIRAICFDIDGTLSDTDDQAVLRLARALSFLRGLLPRRDPQPLARFLVMAAETPGNWLYGLPDRLGLDAQMDAFLAALSRLGGPRPAPSFLLVPQVGEALQRLRARYPLAIVSARNRMGTLAFLEQYALGELFRPVVTAHTCRHTKPYPDPLLYAAEQLGLPPESLLMVGDTSVDILAGKAAGAQTVGVLCGFGEEGELRRAGADEVLASTALLAEVLLPGD